MTDFDPWGATLDDAMAAQEVWRAKRGSEADPCGPVMQWHAAATVHALRAEIEGGCATSGFAALAGIECCVRAGLVAPDWLARAFIRRYHTVLQCEVDSWDDPQAFGRPYPKGTHLAALRKARRLRVAVANAVRDLRAREPDTPMDRHLFERVGRPLGLGKTLAERYYYEWHALWPKPQAKGRRIIRMGSDPAKSRKIAGKVGRRR